MLGCYDFCGYYEWTFAWFDKIGGDTCVRSYWEDCISKDGASHCEKLIREKGFEGMREYWNHTLEEEAAGYVKTEAEGVYRLDITDCPSKGFLIRNGLEQYKDYCDHCMGWEGPVLERTGYIATHQHNHKGQCWWELRKKDDPTPPSKPGDLAGENDVRLRPDWKDSKTVMHTFKGGLETRSESELSFIDKPRE